ncbi:MAG: VOC family protein [Burkholderiaceae bacterium]|nr:VOC family protein [Microbacteriaceae bacterium]
MVNEVFKALADSTRRTILDELLLNDGQARALALSTQKLGFLITADVPLGEHRWLTVVGANEPDGVDLLLEPDGHPASKVFTRALVEDGIPHTSFAVDDVVASHRNLLAGGVRFTREPTGMGPVVMAVLDDTCGTPTQLTSPA